jgi:hypothetical protein
MKCHVSGGEEAIFPRRMQPAGAYHFIGFECMKVSFHNRNMDTPTLKWPRLIFKGLSLSASNGAHTMRMEVGGDGGTSAQFGSGVPRGLSHAYHERLINVVLLVDHK